jgi:hypothetical protein
MAQKRTHFFLPEELLTAMYELAGKGKRHSLVTEILDREIRRRCVLHKRRYIGAQVSSLRNWEANRSEPAVEFMPAIIRSLATIRCLPVLLGRSAWLPVGKRWEFRKRDGYASEVLQNQSGLNRVR